MKYLKTIFALFLITIIISCSKDENNSVAAVDLVITNISPATGPKNTPVTIIGTGFSAINSENTVTINGKVCPLINSTATQLTVSIPPSAGSGKIKVKVGNTEAESADFEFVVTTTVTTLAGNALGSDDGQGTNAQFNIPQGITIDVTGNLYVADMGNHRIRKITPNGFATTIINSFVVVANDFKENNVEKMVVANNDVYCIGTEFNATGTIRTAKFWKNAVPTSITDFKGNFDSLADIKVNGTEVSILYDQVNPTTLRPEVKLWKNNTTSVIATGNNGFSATAMIIKDGVEHILINEGITFDGTKILYLKNRTKTEITDGTTDVQRSYLRVDGSNVCVAYEVDSGFSFSSKYWLNGTTNILNNDGVFEINAVFLAEKDVYITSAKSNNLPKLWTNGKETISKTNSTTSSYKVNDVFVTQ